MKMCSNSTANTRNIQIPKMERLSSFELKQAVEAFKGTIECLNIFRLEAVSNITDDYASVMSSTMRQPAAEQTQVAVELMDNDLYSG